MAWPLHDLTLTTPDLVLRGMQEPEPHPLATVVPADRQPTPQLAPLTPPPHGPQATGPNGGPGPPTARGACQVWWSGR